MLKQRILTALILAPLAIACLFLLPKFGFAIFIALVLGIGAWEWANLASMGSNQRYAYAAFVVAVMFGTSFLPALPILIIAVLWWAFAFYLMINYPGSAKIWQDSSPIIMGLMGVLNIVPAFVALLTLKDSVDSNFLILLLFFLIWGADVGAYFSGRALGKHKLAPAVSPGKSWEGFWGGLVLAAGIAALMIWWLGKPQLNSIDGFIFIAACIFIVMVSVVGDLVESMFKRQRGIKDSSHLLPGHGGILDRVDSLLSAGPFFALFILLIGWH